MHAPFHPRGSHATMLPMFAGRRPTKRVLCEGAAWSLPAFLAVALLLRVPAALFADGFSFPDQQFQYVDPAWHLATGSAWHEPWEYQDGLRSWVYPGVLAAIFRGLLALGLEEPMWLMRGVRGVDALISLLPLWLFWLAIVRWRPVPSPRLPLVLFAGSGLLVSMVQPSGPALAAVLAVAAALAVHGPRWFPAFGGLCLGLAFCCRFQEALFGPPLLGVLLWQRRFGAAAWFCAGCVPGVLLQGFVDLAEHGRFLATPFAYLESNVGLGAASKWRQHPWWFYFVAGVVPTLFLVPPFLKAAWRRIVAGARVLPGAAAAAAVHLLAHSGIGRKALRFELAALALLVAVVAAGVGTDREPAGDRLALWYRRCLVAAHAAIFLGVSLWFADAGAVRLALALRAEPTFAGRVLVVDGDATALGGFYYMRPPADLVASVKRCELSERLRASPLSPGDLVVAVREPLTVEAAQTRPGLELVGSFAGTLDLRVGERRFLYRWR